MNIKKMINKNKIPTNQIFISDLIFIVYYIMLINIDDYFDIINTSPKNQIVIVFTAMLITHILLISIISFKKKVSLKLIICLDIIIISILSFIFIIK